MLYSLPMSFSRIRTVSGKDSSNITNIWSSSLCYIRQCTHRITVRYILHCSNLFISPWTHFSSKMQSWYHWSSDRLAISHSKSIQDIYNVLPLRQCNRSLGAVPSNFYSQKIVGGTQISEFKVRLKLFNNIVNSLLRIRSQGNIINPDRHDNFNLTIGVDIESLIRLQSSESHSLQSSMHLYIPLSGCLFQAIDGF